MVERTTLEAGCTRIDVSTFGYDAASAPRGNRRRSSSKITSEDSVLDKAKRRKTIGTSQDMGRNFSLFSWAIRQHLNYVTKFTFQAKTGDKELNKQIESEVKKLMRRDKFDIARRHGLDRFIRNMEARALVDHDIGIARLNTGHVQAIEGDRIQTPEKVNTGENWTQGVRTNNQGAALEYGIFNRGKDGKGYEFARKINQQNFWLHGHFERFDQYRGISPLMSALNSLQDVYEVFGFSVSRMKIEQLCALAIFREADKKATGLPPASGDTEDEEESEQTGYEVSFNGGPILLDMDPGDKAEFLKPESPGSNTVGFIDAMIAIALKALDIPFSFYNESFTNFFGQRSSWLHYERGCRDKRERIREFLDWWIEWTLTRLILNGTIKLPAGMTLEDHPWEWVPDGMPWWDPVKEINGDILAIKAGFTTPQKVCKERGGGDFFENIDQTNEAIKYAKESEGDFMPDWVPFQEVAVLPREGDGNE